MAMYKKRRTQVNADELVGASRINYLHSALRETHFNVHARLALVQLIKALLIKPAARRNLWNMA